MTPKRGRSDSLTPREQNGLTDALESYVMDQIRRGQTLWSFGAYANGDGSMDKKAPVLVDLLANADLLKIILTYMYTGKCKDLYIVNSIKKIMDRVVHVNNKNLPNTLFVAWLSRCIHCQVSHLRMLKHFPCRFEYRVNQLDHAQFEKLQKLLSAISLDTACAPEPPRPIDRVPKRFLEDMPEIPDTSETPPAPQARAPSPARTSSTTTTPIRLRIPSIFWTDATETPPKTLNPGNLSASALSTPPLPALRGQIRAVCAGKAGAANECTQSGISAGVERAYTGNVRSTLRVRLPGQKGRVSWAEVTAKTHKKHFEIISRVAAAVKDGRIQSKDEAVVMKDGLLASM